MIDQKTTNFQLPLPHPNNQLEEDVLRLRTALSNIDGLIWLLNQGAFPFFTADGSSHPIRIISNG